MAPRASQARRTLAPQGEHIYALGVVGRKTGVTVPDSGVRDEHGMEPIENIFSSPGKPDDRDDSQDDGLSDEEGSGEAAMDITTTSGIGPAALLNGHGSKVLVPLARARSPAKTLLNSPAQRNRLLARNSSSPARGAIVRDDGTTPSSQPIRDQAASKRRIDFRSIASGGPHALSQPLPGRGPANGRRLQPLQQEDDEEEDGALDGEDHNGEEEEEGDMVNDYVEESMAMLDGGDDDDLPAAPEPQQADDEEEISMVDDQRTSAIAARKKAGRPAKQKGPAAPAKPAKPTRKPTKPVAEESDAEDRQEDVENPDEEEEDPAPRPRKPEPGRRGRPPPPKASQAPAAEHPTARGSKKRRSLDADQNAGAKEPSPEPQPKRQRTEGAAKGKKPAAKKPAATSSKSSTGPATASTSASKPSPGAKTAKGRKRKSSIDPGDVSQVVVARRPPLPKSRGLLINRRELPGDSGSMFRTRSGRTSFKPLAYWRNERVDYEKDEAEDAFAGRTHKPKFVLPSIKEVVRVDEPEPEFRPKSRRGGGASSKKGGRRRKSRGGYGSADDDDGDGPADLWELDPGTVTGEVVVWQPEYEFSPPAPNDLVSVMDKQLAISGAAIKTTEVVGGEFRYAKVFSEGFIGAGVVDLPPGSIKRLKNSRKVFMIFFVHIGRVLVTVQETSFRISKGGIFIVPRYNEYTIENDYDHPARIFFSQGQEMSAKPPPEEEAGGDDHGEGDGDEGDEEAEVSEEEEEEGSGEGDD